MPARVDKRNLIYKVCRLKAGNSTMQSATARKRPGRPSPEHPPGTRVSMSFRVRPELKEQMDRAAEKSGRSTAQEIEIRLERSFDPVLPDEGRALMLRLYATYQ